MSLAIDIDHVTRVLLADGWHDVDKASFDIDSYEYRSDDFTVHGGGQSGVCASGFAFSDAETGARLCGPLTAVIAVQVKRSRP